jgi:hypothetical protein
MFEYREVAAVLVGGMGKTITAVTPPVAHMLLGIEAFSHFTPGRCTAGT